MGKSEEPPLVESLGTEVGTYIGSSDGFSDMTDDGKLEGSRLEEALLE